MKKLLFLLVAISVFTITLNSQVRTIIPNQPLTRILFIFDASQSMLGEWESDIKINIARRFLIETVDSLEKMPNVEMALRVYGHQSPVPPQDCNDTRLEVPFGPGNASRIRQKLRYVKPKGTTPLARSIELSERDFPSCANCRNVVLLITDGIEACDGDPCEISRKLQKRGIVLKPFVIGIGISDDFASTFNCIGEYFSASNEKTFKEALNIIITQTLNPTSAQVYLLDSDGNPTESNVAMSFYDNISNKIKHNYMHTINNRGVPDTISLDPLVNYKMVVHTLPPVKVDSVKVVPGKHNIIGVPAPQGSLVISTKDNSYKDMLFIVRENGKMETLNMQKMYKEEKYIVGTYDIEIPTIPIIHVQDVKISQSHTTKVEIPRPGLVTFLKKSEGYGSLYVLEKDEPLRWIYNIESKQLNETLSMNPGRYIIVYRAKEARNTFYTLTRRFDVNSGSNKTIELY